MATTFVSFGPPGTGEPPQPYGIRLNVPLEDVQAQMAQALAESHGLFRTKEMIRNGERDVLINAHQVRFVVEHG
jgi:hypothetical protein